ncbi:hypothetical protein PUR49_21260 [Streptomyces sp. BE147]|uniref:hypothetical protein n=1 Tax=Streptomyces sp. BE147 TaxID=3002524 RepID=UPI002E78BB17|nr:hypothetical protein [Streptomyces sp. BE147]MEE1739018.1 hypothetical protein [Streptomyces sp. BE147]
MRRLIVSYRAVEVVPQPRPADGPYSRAAYNRWERAENRHRRAHRTVLWLARQGIDAGPRIVHGVVVG